MECCVLSCILTFHGDRVYLVRIVYCLDDQPILSPILLYKKVYGIE